MINPKTIVSIIAIIGILVVGIVTLTYMEDQFPEAMPRYDEDFPVGTSPYSYDTGQSGLTNIVVKQTLSDGSVQTIPSANYTYSGTSITIDAEVLYV